MDQYAIGELYRASMIMHFFVACKNARDDTDCRLNLDAPDWKSLVPCPGYVVQQSPETPPPGCRAVLYSPMHQFGDIRCPVTDGELALFTSTNARDTIAGMQDAMRARFPEFGEDEVLREFYKKMYRYDFLAFKSA